MVKSILYKCEERNFFKKLTFNSFSSYRTFTSSIFTTDTECNVHVRQQNVDMTTRTTRSMNTL